MYWYRTTVGPAHVGFTDREAGNLALHVGDDPQEVNRRRASLEIDLAVRPGSVLYLNQVHGNAVADADNLQAGEIPTADASVSAAGRPLAVMVADCVPVVMVGSDSGDPHVCVTAVAHAGRNGLLDGVLEATVTAMQERGAVTIQAVVGPSVCGNCYEVPEQMAADSEARSPGVRAETSWGTPSLDLPGTVVRRLRDLGVEVDRPQDQQTPACTVENQLLSSHRRDPGSGRIVGVITVPQHPSGDRHGSGSLNGPVGL